MTFFKVSQFLRGLYVPIDDDLISRRAVTTIGLTVGKGSVEGSWNGLLPNFLPNPTPGEKEEETFFLYMGIIFLPFSLCCISEGHFIYTNRTINW